MADWSNDNPACVMTWVTCLLLGQSRKAFPGAGDVQMSRLQFWAGSQDGRPARTRAFAVQMIHTFRDMFGAKFEDGKNFTSSLVDVVTVLSVNHRTIADLAEVNDANFRFLEEQ